jgi:hypothetical protein
MWAVDKNVSVSQGPSSVWSPSLYSLVLLLEPFVPLWSGLPLDSASFHFSLELMDVANTREEMRLSTLVAVKSSKPAVPLPLRSLRFLEVDNDWELDTWEESVVDDTVVIPLVHGSGYVIVWLGFKSGSALQVEFVALDVVKLEAILLKDQTDATCLRPKKSGKQHVE